MGKTRQDLQKMKVVELKAICRVKGIPHYNGKNCFKKDELIEAILGMEENVESNEKSITSAVNKVDVNVQNDVEAADKNEEEAASTEVNMEQKMSYIENAKIGALVAFSLSSGKVKSAKIVKKSSKNRKLKLETEYGAEYIVSYDDVIWVRTGARWPRGVYKLLKGTMIDDGRKEQKAEAK